jgi:hypothetical protein
LARSFFCSYLEVEVELTDEREQHIIDRHPGTLPDYEEQLAQTLADPDLISLGVIPRRKRRLYQGC